MPIALTCPKCHASQTVPDAVAGQSVRCPACQSELPAQPATPPPTAKRRALPWVVGLVLAGGAALAAYAFVGRPTPTDFADPDGTFSARFPDTPEARAVSRAEPLRLLWGQQLHRAKTGGTEYS